MKQSLKTFNFLLLAGSLALFSCNNSNSSSTTTTDSTSTTTVGQKIDQAVDTMKAAMSGHENKDSVFVTDVVEANAKEIMMLQDGISHGTSKELKNDARKMLVDHKKLAMEMKDYAAKKNYTLAAPDTSMNDMNSSATPGKDWDKDWADKMKDGHEKTIKKFEDGQNDVQDPELKDMITKTLPTLHTHLDMVQKLQDNLK